MPNNTTTEHTSTNEAVAHDVRRELIRIGFSVSLIGFDPDREVYAFDSWKD